MATGLLGSVDLSANTTSAVYTAPANTVGSVTIRVCNRGASTADVKVAIGLSGDSDISNARLIRPLHSLDAKGVMEDSGVVVGPGQKVFVQSSSSDVNAVVYGFEEPSN